MSSQGNEAKSDSQNLIKLVVFGSGGVGKSALILRFQTGDFAEAYDPTIEDTYRKTITLSNDKVVTLDVTDTAGQEEYKCMRAAWTENADGFLLVYDITKKVTLDAGTSPFLKLIRSVENKANPSPVLLVGTKLDLVTNDDIKRQVSEEEGLQFSKDHALIGHIVTSAKTPTNVADAFALIAEKMSEKTSNPPSAVKRSFCVLL